VATKTQDEAPEQQAVPIVMTLASDKVFPDKAAATGACYSWSKDGAAASTAQWVLPVGAYTVTLNWVLDGAGTAMPASDSVYVYTTSSAVSVPPAPVWADDGDGTYSGTATGSVQYSATSVPWDVRYNPQSSQPQYHPITLKAGSTVTLTPVLAAAPSLHTWINITPNSATTNWSPTGLRDIEIDGVIAITANSGYRRANLSPGTTYSTRTRTDSPESEWTAAVPLVTPALEAAPAAPTFTSITPTSFVVHWTPTGPRAVEVDGVEVEDYANSGYTASGKTAETSYAVRTRKVDNYGDPLSEWSAVGNVTTLAAGPPVPTGVAVSDIDTTGFTVSCDAMPGATSYEVRTTEVQGAP
jgi:hypothetical protein